MVVVVVGMLNDGGRWRDSDDGKRAAPNSEAVIMAWPTHLTSAVSLRHWPDPWQSQRCRCSRLRSEPGRRCTADVSSGPSTTEQKKQRKKWWIRHDRSVNGRGYGMGSMVRGHAARMPPIVQIFLQPGKQHQRAQLTCKLFVTSVSTSCLSSSRSVSARYPMRFSLYFPFAMSLIHSIWPKWVGYPSMWM